MSTIINGLYARVSRLYARLSISLLITFLRNVIDMMTGNVSFATPTPSLADFSTAVNDLETKTQAALNGGRVEMVARDIAVTNTLGLARQLGTYVELTAAGDLEVLLSSGFDAIRSPSPSVVPGAPTNPRFAYTGVSGELVLRFAGDYNVKNFSVQHAESADGPWTDDGLSTSTRVKITNLTPGKTYWGRACANGAAGSSDWSAPTSMIAI